MKAVQCPPRSLKHLLVSDPPLPGGVGVRESAGRREGTSCPQKAEKAIRACGNQGCPEVADPQG